MQITYDANKKQANLAKHGLDFDDAYLVLQNKYRLDVPVVRNNEHRTQAMAYVMEALAVLTVVFVDNKIMRAVSFRRASENERKVYYEWLESK
jgi:uncharacterized DUF497 family protein